RSASDKQFSSDRFGVLYATLGAQRNSKILGIFARLAKRDGKRGYLAHIPRVARYLERNLAHPALASLRDWYENQLPPFHQLSRLSAGRLRPWPMLRRRGCWRPAVGGVCPRCPAASRSRSCCLPDASSSTTSLTGLPMRASRPKSST